MQLAPRLDGRSVPAGPLPTSGELVGAGDVDGDGHADVIVLEETRVSPSPRNVEWAWSSDRPRR